MRRPGDPIRIDTTEPYFSSDNSVCTRCRRMMIADNSGLCRTCRKNDGMKSQPPRVSRMRYTKRQKPEDDAPSGHTA